MNLTRLRQWLILINVSISVFMATLDGSIVNIALPAISKAMSVNIGAIQWIVTSYLLAISVLLLIVGKISDLYGKKKIFAVGFMVFTIGSTLCGFSSNLTMLVLSRVLQAIGAASMMALSQGIITSVFDPSERGKALGITGTTVAIGSLVGPSLGGILVHTVGWQSIFFINIPIGIIGTIVTFLVIPELHEVPGSKQFDYKGSSLFISSILLLFVGLLLFQEDKISITLCVFMLLTALMTLYFFIRVEKRTTSPLIDLNLFKIKTFSLGLSTAYLSFIALFSTILFLPFYLQLVLKLDALQAGLLISAYPLTSAIFAPFSGWLSDKMSYKPLTIAGLSLNTLVLLRISTFNTSTSHLDIVLMMVLMGAGMALFQSPNNSSVMGSVPRNQLGVVGGISALFRNLGMVSGTTLSVLLFSLTTKMNINNISDKKSTFDAPLFLKGFQFVLIFAALSYLIAVAISLFRMVEKAKEKNKSNQLRW